MLIHSLKNPRLLWIAFFCLTLLLCCVCCLSVPLGLKEKEWVANYHTENIDRLLTANEAISKIQAEIESSMLRQINYKTLVDATDLDASTESGLEKIKALNKMLSRIRDTNALIDDAILYDAGRDMFVTAGTYLYRKVFNARIYQYDFNDLVYALSYAQPLSSRGSLGAYGFIYYSPDRKVVKDTVVFIYVPIHTAGRASKALLLMADKQLIVNCLAEVPLIESDGHIIFSRDGKILTRGDEAFVMEAYTSQSLYKRIASEGNPSGYLRLDDHVFAYYSINPNNEMVVVKLTRANLLKSMTESTEAVVAVCKYIIVGCAILMALLAGWVAWIWRKTPKKPTAPKENMSFLLFPKRELWNEGYRSELTRLAKKEPNKQTMACLFAIDPLPQSRLPEEERKNSEKEAAAVYDSLCQRLQRKIGVYAKTVIFQGAVSALLIQTHEDTKPLDAKVIYGIVDGVYSHYRNKRDITFSVLMSPVYASAELLRDDMPGLLGFLKTAMLKKSHSLTCMPSSPQKAEDAPFPFVSQYLQTIPYLMEKDQNFFIREIRRIITQEFRWDSVSYSGILYQGCSLVNACMEHCAGRNVEIEPDYDVFLSALMEKGHLPEVVAYICSVCDAIHLAYHSAQIRATEEETSQHKENVAAYIHEHYMEDISLSQISAYHQMSDSYFSKYFKKHMNVSFNNYLHSYRMEKVQEILKENPGITMQRAAQMVGYNSYKTFSRQYKVIFGYSPKNR